MRIRDKLLIGTLTAGVLTGCFQGTPSEDPPISDIASFLIKPVPEPSTMLLLGSGLFGLGAFRKKFKI